MTEACPLSSELINEKVARVNGALTVLCLIVFLLTPVKAVIWVLGADFLIRGFIKPSYSFFSFASRSILRLLRAEPDMINAGPKIFAAKVGFVFCCLIALLQLLNLPGPGAVIAAILLFFAFLETAAGFCVACRLYPYMPNFVK